LQVIRQTTAKVAFWTEARQKQFGRWLVDEKHLAAGTIERHFTVIGAAFKDAAKVKMRDTPLKGQVECALIAYAPEIAMKRSNIPKVLKIAPPKKGGYVPTFDDMVKFIDLQKSEHLRRWTILSLTTWARPEAVADFEPARQSNPTTGILDLNPPGRPQTNKFRPRIATPQSLSDWLDEWSDVDAEAWKEKNGAWPEVPLPLLMFKQKRVANVKKGVKRLGDDNGLPDFTQYTPRRFMATMIRKLCFAPTSHAKSAAYGSVIPWTVRGRPITTKISIESCWKTSPLERISSCPSCKSAARRGCLLLNCS
jgi:hypothetical protein